MDGQPAIGLQQLRVTQVAVGDEHLLARRDVPLCAAGALFHSATHLLPRTDAHSLPVTPGMMLANEQTHRQAQAGRQ